MSRNTVISPRGNSELKAAEASEAEREAVDAEAERQFLKAITAKDINWNDLATNELITKKELGLILDYDKQTPSDQADILNEKGTAYAALFVRAIDAIRTKETVEYLIVLLDNMITEDPSRVKLFSQLSSSSPPIDPYAPLVRVVTLTEVAYNPYAIARATYITALLLANAPTITPHHTTFIRHVITRLNTPNTSNRDIIALLNALKPILRNETLQAIFAESKGIHSLGSLLNRDHTNAQFIYAITFNLWLLSYKSDYSAIISSTGTLKRVVSLLKTQIMEKVIRITFALIRNLVVPTDAPLNYDGTQQETATSNTIHKELIGLAILPTIDVLIKRKYKDPDILPDMELVQQTLSETVKKLSTFDLYYSEVISGNLQWTPAHKNEIFWRENIIRFEERGYKLVARLIELLLDEDDLVREIACHDVGEFARFSPEGKRVINRLGGKPKLMINLQHKNAKVSKAALLATQKLMVANWEFLAKSSAGGVAALVQKGGSTQAK